MAQNKTQKFFQKIFKPFLKLVTTPGVIIFIVLGLMLILSVTGLNIVVKRMDVSKNTFGRTLTDTLLTIISTGIIGTVLAMLLANYKGIQSNLEKEREKRQLRENNRDQYRKDSLDKLNKLYRKAKNARRMLRAKGFATLNENDEDLLIRSEYDLFMDDINDSQLELEDIRGQISTSQSAFLNPGGLESNLKDMDDYLGKLIRDYEKFRAGFSGNPPTRRIGDFPDTKSFLAHGGEDFKKYFSKKCKLIREEIRKDINLFDKKSNGDSSA